MQYCRLKTLVSISITMQSFFGQNKRKTAFFALTKGLILTTRQVLNTNVCTRCQIFGLQKKKIVKMRTSLTINRRLTNKFEIVFLYVVFSGSRRRQNR